MFPGLSSRFNIQSPLSPGQIRQKLTEKVEPIALFKVSFFEIYSKQEYEGYFNERMFDIRRAQTSFLKAGSAMHIYGQITGTSNGSNIMVRIRLNPFAILFLIALTIGCIVLTYFVINGILSGAAKPIAMVVPILLFMIGYGMPLLLYKDEIRTSKEDLLYWFEGKCEK